MKKLLSILLLLSLAYQCLGCLGVFAWYTANRQWIAAELCENRDQPQLHCNGQCVLMKKLKTLEDQPDSSKDTGRLSKAEAPAFILPDVPLFFFPVLPVGNPPLTDSENYPSLPQPANFRPPCLFV